MKVSQVDQQSQLVGVELGQASSSLGSCSYLKAGLRATDHTLSYMGIVALGQLEVKDQI